MDAFIIGIIVGVTSAAVVLALLLPRVTGGGSKVARRDLERSAPQSLVDQAIHDEERTRASSPDDRPEWMKPRGRP